jgi:hypothetical protein
MIFGYDGPEEEAASAKQSLEWVTRCHAVKVKELEDQILVLEKENEQWEEYCTELENTEWKKKYDKLRRSVDQYSDHIREAMLDD